MNKSELLKEVEIIKRDYSIKINLLANDTHRKRITRLITDLLLELDIDELEITTGMKFIATLTKKKLSNIERYAFIARELEPAIFNRLKTEKLFCDKLENEAKCNLLDIWNDGANTINMDFIDKIIDILKMEVKNGKDDVTGSDIRSGNDEDVRNRKERFELLKA